MASSLRLDFLEAEDVQLVQLEHAICEVCGNSSCGYCKLCMKNLCVGCLQTHFPKFDVISVANVFSFSSCTKHQKEVKYYCQLHEKVICQKCLEIKHFYCSVNLIGTPGKTELAENEMCKSNLVKGKKNDQNCNTGLETVHADIKKFRQEINHRLDEMERGVCFAVETLKQRRNRSLEPPNTCYGYGSIVPSPVSFILGRKISEEPHEYCFKPNPAIASLFRKEQSLGTLETLSHTKLADTSRQPKFLGNICVHSPDDKNRSWITGIAYMDPKMLLITDKDNNALKMVDIAEASIIRRIELGTSPWDVTSVGNNEFAVTLPFKQLIICLCTTPFFPFFKKLALRRRIKVHGKCYSISLCDKNLIVSFQDPGKLQIIDMQGVVLKTVTENSDGKEMFIHPNFVTSDSNNIYVSDWTKHSVIQLNRQGEQTDRYTGIVCPQGIALQANGSIFVCDFGGDKCNIQRISPDFSTGKVVLESLNKPFALCCHEKDLNRTLYISSGSGDDHNDNFIQIFKIPDFVFL